MAEAMFTASLRVTHPTEAHQVIAQSLGLEPEFAHTAGEPKTTPKGRVLDGVNKNTYCCFTLLAKQSGDFTEGIKQVLPLLNSHKSYLQKLTGEGGKAEIFVGVFVERTIGFTLEVEDMAALANLSLELSIEVYC